MKKEKPKPDCSETKSKTDRSKREKAKIDSSEKKKSTTNSKEKRYSTAENREKKESETVRSEKKKTTTDSVEKKKTSTESSEKKKPKTDCNEKKNSTTDISEKKSTWESETETILTNTIEPAAAEIIPSDPSEPAGFPFRDVGEPQATPNANPEDLDMDLELYSEFTRNVLFKDRPNTKHVTADNVCEPDPGKSECLDGGCYGSWRGKFLRSYSRFKRIGSSSKSGTNSFTPLESP